MRCQVSEYLGTPLNRNSQRKAGLDTPPPPPTQVEWLAALEAAGELRSSRRPGSSKVSQLATWPCDYLARLNARSLALLNAHYAADFEAFGFRRAATPAELLVAVRRAPGGRIAACSASLPDAPRGCWHEPATNLSQR